MPKELRAKIEFGTNSILKARKAPSARAAKGAVQSHVWKTRDKNWVPLQGERANEKRPKKLKKSPRRRIEQRQRRLEP